VTDDGLDAEERSAAMRRLVWSMFPDMDPGWVVKRLTDRNATIDQVTLLRDARIHPGAWHRFIDYQVPGDVWHLTAGGEEADCGSFARVWGRIGPEVHDWHALFGNTKWSAIWHLIYGGIPLEVAAEVHALNPEIALWLYLITDPSKVAGTHAPVPELANWVRAGLIFADPDSLFRVLADHGRIGRWVAAVGDRAHLYAAAGFTIEEAVAAEGQGGWDDGRLRALASLRG
jgi:hypothetical protein